ncbi:galactonate dehydratase [Citrobacter portucalensis]|uniref:galactonate dehydratase n=3 Tax=Citrobacter portucalensis TaxID=1639133 RepID=UPI00226B2AC3|nr:galactonate dehydratase [Citrobacter portucalensis]MCX8981049.1 galactonate dehydratase [Citrobacter portucalensis]MCX9009166.1 galactonate dehydratase [Citrobacter portucalensis]
MKIVDIQTLVVNADLRNWVFVKVITDVDGLYGWGEGTLEWKTRAVVSAVDDIKPLMIGQDPRDIEQAFRRMTKFHFWQPGTIAMTAISAIEHALWDILGKSVGLPVWRLLGGKTHNVIKAYTHLGQGNAKAIYETFNKNAFVDKALEVVDMGYQAMKILFVPYCHYTSASSEISMVEETIGAVRQAVGNDIDIMVDFHGRPASTSLAVQYIKALEPSNPLFVEEPIQPGDPAAMRDVMMKVSCPVATGERLIQYKEFEQLFLHRAVNIIQPDLSHCGGLWMAKKIAAAAEGAYCGVAPHNPAGPIAGAVALHFDVSTPNFVIQEEMIGAVPWFHDVVDTPIRMVDGCWQIPEKPGLGVEVNEAEARRHPYQPEPQSGAEAQLREGTIVNW